MMIDFLVTLFSFTFCFCLYSKLIKLFRCFKAYKYLMLKLVWQVVKLNLFVCLE